MEYGRWKCIRDFVHIMDIAKGHSDALKYMKKNKSINLSINLGSVMGPVF